MNESLFKCKPEYNLSILLRLNCLAMKSLTSMPDKKNNDIESYLKLNLSYLTVQLAERYI